MKSTRSAIERIRINYLIALMPLILYGFYKNGFILYSKNLTNIYGLLKPLLIPICSYFIAIVIEMVFKKGDKLTNSLLPTNALLVACLINPNINIIIYIVVLTVSLIVCKILSKIKQLNFNHTVFIKIMFFIILAIFLSNSYSNIYESSSNIAISAIDKIFGRNIGGLHSTSIVLCLIGYIYLSFKEHYKSDIPIIILSSYLLLALVFSVISNDLNIFVDYLCMNGVVFSAIFVATDTNVSPYTKKGRAVYGCLIGILSFILIRYLTVTEGVFLAIFLSSLFTKLIDKFFALN